MIYIFIFILHFILTFFFQIPTQMEEIFCIRTQNGYTALYNLVTVPFIYYYYFSYFVLLHTLVILTTLTNKWEKSIALGQRKGARVVVIENTNNNSQNENNANANNNNNNNSNNNNNKDAKNNGKNGTTSNPNNTNNFDLKNYTLPPIANFPKTDHEGTPKNKAAIYFGGGKDEDEEDEEDEDEDEEEAVQDEWKSKGKGKRGKEGATEEQGRKRKK
jgi:hypothetical protein